jgi:hypothetical protein
MLFYKINARLPTEKRNLCVTYLLRQCRDADHRVVASAFRGLGMIVTLPACQNDAAFLVRLQSPYKVQGSMLLFLQYFRRKKLAILTKMCLCAEQIIVCDIGFKKNAIFFADKW